MLKKLLKISLLVITGIISLVLLVLFIEPNENYTTTGILTLTQNPAVVKQCGDQKQFYSIEVVVVYRDKNGMVVDYSTDLCNLSEHNPFRKRLVNCQADVNYAMGRWLNDHSWLKPGLSIHSCIFEPLN